MRFPRQSGLLLHVSSLPNEFGIGDLGPEAFKFVDFLCETKQRLWQILPLCPTLKGNSPYSGLSAFAGNPLLVSPTVLIEDGLLTAEDVADCGTFPVDEIDFERVSPLKRRLLQVSHDRFVDRSSAEQRAAYSAFCRQNAWWLDDFALFATLAEHFGSTNWSRWPAALVRREAAELQHWRQALAEQIEQANYAQFLFASQWQRLRRYATERGIEIVGDMPIFVAYESADVWAYPQYFQLDADRLPKVVAGVPPDAFSETGQLWGNPLFDWQRLAEADYDWWVRRLRHAFSLVDILRLDHFRGFESYWEVPADAPTALTGHWAKGPGVEFFASARKQIGEMRIIAEDLGIITDDVHALREQLEFAGMRVLQFSNNETDYHHPVNYPPHSVAYTGTHDNDTLVGWLTERYEQTKAASPEQHTAPVDDPVSPHAYWKWVELVLQSAADTAIIPVQDVLGLGSDARMNTPGRAEGNWRWRMRPDAITPAISERLLAATIASRRAGDSPMASN